MKTIRIGSTFKNLLVWLDFVTLETKGTMSLTLILCIGASETIPSFLTQDNWVTSIDLDQSHGILMSLASEEVGTRFYSNKSD